MKTIETANLPELDDFTQELVYCGLDTMMTHEIRAHLMGEFTEGSLKTYEDSRNFLAPSIDMMHRGFKVSPRGRDELLPVLQARRLKYQGWLDRLAHVVWGKDLNINSPVQMSQFFYDWLFLPKYYESKKGERKVTTGRKAMESLKTSHVKAMPFATLVMALRDLDKMISVLGRELHNGRWHATFNVVGTDTFRWSSSAHPVFGGASLQNIDDELRRVFVPDEGYELFSLDQQGAEARAVAFISGDEEYIKAVESGDVHTMVASMTFGFPPDREEAEKEYYRGDSYRQVCKKLGHGSSYVGSARSLAIQARIPVRLVEDFQHKYFGRFKGIQRWHTWTKKQLETKGYICNVFGDRRQFWDRLWDDSTLRAAVAFQPQSLVGKLTALVIRRLWDAYRGRDLQLLANGHDAIIFQIKKEKVDKVLPEAVKLFHYPLQVTDITGKTRELVIPWDVSRGLNWGKKHPTLNPEGLR